MRPLLACIWLIVATIVATTAIVIAFLFLPRRIFVMPIGKLWARSVLFVAGVRVVVDGVEDLPGYGPFLYMPNHLSNLDIIAMTPSLRGDIRFIAKKSLRWVPFFGWALAASGAVFIDRARRPRAIAKLGVASANMRAGATAVIFPEGTRSRDGFMHEFKRGPFHLAIDAGIPIVPVGVIGTERLWPVGSLWIRSGEVRIRYGRPLAIEEGATFDSLSAATRAEVVRLAGSTPPPA